MFITDTVEMKPRVLVLGSFNKSLPEAKKFLDNFECIEYTITSEEQLVQDFQTVFKDISGIYASWLGFTLVGGFRGRILKNAPSSLKVVAVCSVGYDGYDTEGMTCKGIALTHVPSDRACLEVADYVVYCTYMGFRNFRVHENYFRPRLNHTIGCRLELQNARLDTASGKVHLGKFDGYAFGHYAAQRPCISPRGHNAVIVGFGRIGQQIGHQLHQLGMNIHYVKRRQLPENAVSYPASYHSNVLDTKEFADLIVIACPGTPETTHLINADVFNAMKKPLRLINVGRGIVIDEKALVVALRSKKVVFAALDVFENEPLATEELFERDDVLLTPHIAASTEENFDYTAITAMKNIGQVLLEKIRGTNQVN